VAAAHQISPFQRHQYSAIYVFDKEIRRRITAIRGSLQCLRPSSVGAPAIVPRRKIPPFDPGSRMPQASGTDRARGAGLEKYRSLGPQPYRRSSGCSAPALQPSLSSRYPTPVSVISVLCQVRIDAGQTQIVAQKGKIERDFVNELKPGAIELSGLRHIFPGKEVERGLASCCEAGQRFVIDRPHTGDMMNVAMPYSPLPATTSASCSPG
jgi:hypothetical protein